MGFDFSELDAQLAALGEVRDGALDLARRYAGDAAAPTAAQEGGAQARLDSVDSTLASLGVAVPVQVSARVPAKAHPPTTTPVAAKPAEPKPAAQPAKLEAAPQGPAKLEPAPKAPAKLEPAPKAPAKLEPAAQAPAAQPEPVAQPVHVGPPRSEEIVLPAPVAERAQPQSGELSLDPPAPRSGSFALDLPADGDLDEDTDADFEAEFAALSAPQPGPKSVKPAPAAPLSAPPSASPPSDPPPAPLAVEVEVDEETDAVLALFDAAESTSSAAPSDAAPPFKGLSDELEPSVLPSPGSRDPDAEFDALFEEASKPSSVPQSVRDPEQDSVDDLLRDLGAPRVPQDLARAVARTPAFSLDDEIGDPTEIIERGALDASPSQRPGAANPFPEQDSDLPSSEFEIVMDDVVEDDAEPAPKAPKPPARPRPPEPPPGPGGEKRPSFLGRLFKGPKDPGTK
jgi:hypothetical protein